MSHTTRRHWAAVLSSACALFSAACGSTANTEPTDSGRCPQTYEFGNYGCSHVVAIVSAPDGAAVARPRIAVHVRPLHDLSRFPGTMYSTAVLFGAVDLHSTLMLAPLPGNVDTVSIWVIAQVYEPVISPPNEIARDSVRHLLRYAPVGALRIIDTVRLTPRRP